MKLLAYLSLPARSTRGKTGLPPELLEKSPDVRGQCLGLFESGEMATTICRRPALDVEHTFGHGAGWADNLTREGDIGSRDLDAWTADNGTCYINHLMAHPGLCNISSDGLW
jgi:hypothetical protein